MEQVSKEELRRQISREGKAWDLFPMETVFGDVVVGEEVPVVVPLPFAGVIVEVDKDITGVSQDFPFSSLLRLRVGRDRRAFWTGVEVARETKKKDKMRPINDAKEEFEKDFRSGIIRDRIVTGGLLGQNASTGSRYGRGISRRTRR